MAFTKITNTELNARGATTLPNQPTISATALKQEFDAPAKNVVAPKFNNLIDELESTTASASLGAVAPSGHTGSTVQAVINSIASEVGTLEGQIPVIAAQAHSHPNKDLLDTYTQTNADITQAIADDHTHANKALLDTYTQTESDLADAVANKHAHSNKSLLDEYNQSNSDIEDAIAKKHTHSNKALLDTYTQTESDLSNAVANTHAHSNKAVIDKFGEDSSGNPTYDGNPIGGGGTGNVNDAYKTVKVGLTSLVASGEDTLIFKGGSNVTLVADNLEKSITINSTGGGGQSTGDMLAADYDSDFDVKNAGGIKSYVAGLDYVAKSSTAGLLKNDGTVDQTQYVSDISGKTDKVTGAVSGNFAALTITGNLTDSGKKASDFMASDGVEANPSGSATGSLSKLRIGSSIYSIEGGGGTTIVQIPSVVGDSFTYNGISQGPTITGLDATHCTVTGATAVNAGSYTLTIALNDPSSMVWSDLTTADKTYSYTIAKASQTITASKNSVSLTALQPSDTVTISGQQGSLNVSSSDTGVATVSESSGVVTITGAGNGSATVSVYAEETTNYTQSATVSISVASAIAPDGKTVTPTDTIQTWLNCANIWDKSYTTIGEVLADSTTLLALISSNNAADYMKRSTTWASAVTANSTAMTDIGANDYCASSLLSDSTWRTAICNSAYFESVLNEKVPYMTSNTTPSGEVIWYDPTGSATVTGDYAPYKAFQQSSSAVGIMLKTNSSFADAYLGYDFKKNVKVYKIHGIANYSRADTSATLQFNASADGSTWTTQDSFVAAHTGEFNRIIASTGAFQKFVLKCTSPNGNFNGFGFADLQFYGRSS